MWLYADAQQIALGEIFERASIKARAFILAEENEIRGVAIVSRSGSQTTVHVDATDLEPLGAFVTHMMTDYAGTVRFICGRQEVADRISFLSHGNITGGRTRLFTQVPVDEKNDDVVELSSVHIDMVRALPGERAKHYDDMRARGCRFFAYIQNGIILSMCASARVNAFRSEIIALQTFGEDNRRKGFARKVCGRALNESLLDSSIVTWSTGTTNLASISTAKSLGFSPYFSLQEVIVPGKRRFFSKPASVPHL